MSSKTTTSPKTAHSIDSAAMMPFGKARQSLPIDEQLDANLSDIGFTVHPNLIHRQAAIQLSLPTNLSVRLSLYNHQGQAIKQYIDGQELAEGKHFYQLNAEQLTPGFYYLQLQTKNGVITHKIVVQR